MSIRLKNLQTGSIEKLVLLGLYSGAVEAKLHRQFRKSRLRKGSEYFKPTRELLHLIKNLNTINKLLAQLK
jgi:hypothetical protein